MLFSDAAETVATATPRRRDDAPLADMSVEFNEALQQKVQSQADELIMKTRELGTARSYGELCERRLLELAPGHALPVTEASLGDFPDPLAEAPHQRSDGSQVKNPKDVSGIPAYIVAKNALVRKVERECEEQIFALKKAMRALEERNSEMSSQLKRSRLERDAKEREVSDIIITVVVRIRRSNSFLSAFPPSISPLPAIHHWHPHGNLCSGVFQGQILGPQHAGAADVVSGCTEGAEGAQHNAKEQHTGYSPYERCR